MAARGGQGGGGRPAQQQGQQGKQQERSRIWSFVCAVAYELRPFTPPTRHDVRQFYHSTRQTLRLLAQEGTTLAELLTSAARTHVTWRRVLPLAAYSGLQWLAARVEFGLVFFILAMLGLIFTVGLGDDASRRGRNGERLSPWSVFNQGMRSILGTLDPAQFEAEIRNYGLEDGGLGEQLLLRRNNNQQEQQEWQGQGQQQQGGGGGGAAAGTGPARKSGKKARRKFDKEERRRRRLGNGGGDSAGAGGNEEVWEEDWLSEDEG